MPFNCMLYELSMILDNNDQILRGWYLLALWVYSNKMTYVKEVKIDHISSEQTLWIWSIIVVNMQLFDVYI